MFNFGNWKFEDGKIQGHGAGHKASVLEVEGMNVFPDLNYKNIYIYTHPKWDSYVIEIRFPTSSKFVYTFSFPNYIELMNKLTPQYFLDSISKEKKE
jgi:saccharopine dehydrogenase-like NADP-dependent oxidoreductase